MFMVLCINLSYPLIAEQSRPSSFILHPQLQSCRILTFKTSSRQADFLAWSPAPHPGGCPDHQQRTFCSDTGLPACRCPASIHPSLAHPQSRTAQRGGCGKRTCSPHMQVVRAGMLRTARLVPDSSQDAPWCDQHDPRKRC